ncbi:MULTISPECIES: hypothetical protein [unclassified Streptomyces]|uniref:hypothetical protein n=1 Tax=unclassified Streptomyces TaxID=2593676 RepID=UPI000B0DEE2C|nr:MULTISPECIES: hypothetical protein [unclassified Streptomyces]AZM60747.1 hypothetical protein DLM49_15285 [Streptomyces sp. WAC 01438]RSM92866.1 hypothetical protein DMA10_23270 [Streptomyces sp. WAC 01420]
MTAGWGSRTVRAAVFAAVCVLLAALGHVMMSGSDVPLWTLGAGTVATGAVGWFLAGRERGLLVVVAVAVAAQTALHTVFSLTQPATGADASMHHMGMSHMPMTHMPLTHTPVTHADMSHMPVTHTATAHMPLPHMSGDYMDVGAMGPFLTGGDSSSGMLAAHLLAALLTGLWLAHGEKAAFRILRSVAARLAAPLRLLLALPVVPDRRRVRPGRPRSDRAPGLLLLVHAITSRGPPVGTAVL